MGPIIGENKARFTQAAAYEMQTGPCFIRRVVQKIHGLVVGCHSNRGIAKVVRQADASSSHSLSFIRETGCLFSPGAVLYTSVPEELQLARDLFLSKNRIIWNN